MKFMILVCFLCSSLLFPIVSWSYVCRLAGITDRGIGVKLGEVESANVFLAANVTVKQFILSAIPDEDAAKLLQTAAQDGIVS